MKKRYSALRFVATTSAVLGFLIAAIGIVGVIERAIEATSVRGFFFGGWGSPALLGYFSAIVGGIVLIAIAGAIRCVIDIESNTRRAADCFAAFAPKPVGSVEAPAAQPSAASITKR